MTGLRPSSLGVWSKTYESQGKVRMPYHPRSFLTDDSHTQYPRLMIFQTAPLTWLVPLNIRYFKVSNPSNQDPSTLIFPPKGFHNSPVGQSYVMTFDPVSNYYNVPFDAAMWLVLHLFVWGTLEGIKASHIMFIVGPLTHSSQPRPCKTLPTTSCPVSLSNPICEMNLCA